LQFANEAVNPALELVLAHVFATHVEPPAANVHVDNNPVHVA
jgi:hypothetical protein